MCKVTYIPLKDSLFITSSRDEKREREAAIEPRVYRLKTGRVLFPKDGHAGGTWIAIHEFGHLIVLLNGAGQPHAKKDRYAASRGQILLNLIDQAKPVKAFENISLEQIEPFTAVIMYQENLIACRWDGRKKFIEPLDGGIPHIWSSVTLYTPEIIRNRTGRFQQWLRKNSSPSQSEILDFHLFTGEVDGQIDLSHGEKLISTVSITSISVSALHASMVYLELNQNKTFKQELVFANAIPQHS